MKFGTQVTLCLNSHLEQFFFLGVDPTYSRNLYLSFGTVKASDQIYYWEHILFPGKCFFFSKQNIIRDNSNMNSLAK